VRLSTVLRALNLGCAHQEASAVAEANSRQAETCSFEIWHQSGTKTPFLKGVFGLGDVISPTESQRVSVVPLAHNPKVGGSNPPPATTYQLFGAHWLPLATALGTHATTSLTGQHASNDHTVGGTLARRHGPRIDIHRALNGRVPEQFLLDFDVSTHSTRQARVGMPKRVPANLADPGAHGCRFNVPSQNALLPTWLPLAIRKYPVKRFSVQATLPVCPEGIGETRIQPEEEAPRLPSSYRRLGPGQRFASPTASGLPN
jgi:hypothetical protein